MFDMGGFVTGSSTSNAVQSALVQFIPSVTQNQSPALISPYPAGQGLATVNSALPASAAYGSASGATTIAGLSLTTVLLLAAAGFVAWHFLRKR